MTTAPADKPKASRDQRDGISRPSADNKCGQVWAALDALKAEGKDLTFEALRLTIDTKIADATIRTQRQRWKQDHA